MRSQESEEPNRSGASNEITAGKEGVNSNHDEDGAASNIVERLVKELPPALRMELNKDRHADDGYLEKQRRFQEAMRRNGYVELRGFWEPDKGFGDSFKTCPPGPMPKHVWVTQPAASHASSYWTKTATRLAF